MISPISDDLILQERIRNKTFDWEKIVPVASSHLIIPLLYFKLKEKHVLDLLPDDLRSYLKEIARQNTERNETILKEIYELSLLLNSENIDHVFLKGAALLASGVYAHKGERMIGDIDILVRFDQCLKAQQLLIRNGYTEAQKSLTDIYFEQKHLPRLIPKTKLAAIELHRRLLRIKSNKILHENDILKNKQLVKDIYIPDDISLFLHCVLNFEVNDLGYYYNYLGMRSTYDALLLVKDISDSQITNKAEHSYLKSFFYKASCYFEFNRLSSIKTKPTIKRQLFLLKQKNRSLNKIYIFVLNHMDVMSLIVRRLYIFVTNSSYRQDSFRKRREILKFIKSRLLIE
jgi:hypothetical protein